MTFFSHQHFAQEICGVPPRRGQSPYPASIWGAKKPLIPKIHTICIIPLLFRGAQTPLSTSMGGHGRIGPLDPPLPVKSIQPPDIPAILQETGGSC